MLEQPQHLPMAVLQEGLDEIRGSPKNGGMLQLIVCRPDIDERQLFEESELNVVEGLVGDTWKNRASSRMPDGQPHPDAQVSLMNTRSITLIARTRERWPLAGDQLFVDFDLSRENLPCGTRLAIGNSILEITDLPHRGCKKFKTRFGVDALKFVNSAVGRELNLRGVYARVVQSGTIRRGDIITKQ